MPDRSKREKSERSEDRKYPERSEGQVFKTAVGGRRTPALIEEEQRQKVNAGGDEARLTAAPNLPLSFFQRVFPTPYRPTPCAVQPVKLSFNHYRKRVLTGPAATPNVGQTPNYLVTPKREDESDSNLGPEDTDECTPSDPEIRYGCSVPGCGKRYKNNTALRLHLRSVHGIVPDEAQQPIPVTPEGANIAVPGGQSPSVGSPTKYAASRPHKCSQCAKRYKTPQGLQNHISQSHQKMNGASSADNSPSPAVLAQMIMQKSQQAHGGIQSNERSPQNQPQLQQYQQQQQQQTPQRPSAPLPVSMTNQGSTPGYHGGERSPMNMQPQHMPVRSVPVQQNRMVSQGHPPMTTGQMLQQQLLQQKRAQAQQYIQHQQQQSPQQQSPQQQQHQHHNHQQQQMQHLQNGPEQQQHAQMHHQPQQQNQQQQHHSQMDMRRYAQQQPINGQIGAGVESYVPPVVEQATQ